MDFANRSAQPQPAHPSAPAGPASVNRAGRGGDKSKAWRVAAVAFMFCLTILAVGTIGMLFFGSDSQSKFVDSKKYQAVFLTNGQVYFGNLKAIGRDYFQLNNIFYLTQNTTTDSKGNTTTDGNYTLVKLGCQQIHDPYDQMIVERDQVSFWENLQDGGKVVKSIKEFNTKNPNGPDCSQVSSQTQASSNSTTQGSTSSTSGNTSTTSNTTNTTTTTKP